MIIPTEIIMGKTNMNMGKLLCKQELQWGSGEKLFASQDIRSLHAKTPLVEVWPTFGERQGGASGFHCRAMFGIPGWPGWYQVWCEAQAVTFSITHGGPSMYRMASSCDSCPNLPPNHPTLSNHRYASTMDAMCKLCKCLISPTKSGDSSAIGTQLSTSWWGNPRLVFAV